MNFHYVSIRAWKDPQKKWYDIPYLTTDDVITMVLESWKSEWRMALDLSVGSSKSTVKKNKGDVRLMMELLAERRRNEVEDKDKEKRATKK